MEKFDDTLKENFNELMDSVSEELLISDGEGRVMRVDSRFETFYGVGNVEDLLGKTVYELEREGLFKPSVIALVLEKKEKITIVQKNRFHRDVVVTATPVFDQKGRIKFVVSYSRDITEMVELQERYSNLQKKFKKQANELNKLKYKTKVDQHVVSNSKEMEKIRNLINRIANFDANVLILGESGVGKTMIAKMIHEKSNRAKKAFVDINCAAIPENLLESELFGYEKGAFTGANDQGKTGLIEMAQGGTLLLDEISEMPVALQAKLLKVIQEKRIIKLGAIKGIEVDFRLIAASNQALGESIKEGKFRNDLFYRLNVVSITIPPLRERTEDIIPLLTYFIKLFNEKYHLHKSFAPKAVEAFLHCSWPGNVRELSNAVERTLVTSEKDLIDVDELPKEIFNQKADRKGEKSEEVCDLNKELEKMEKDIIVQAHEKYKTTVGVAKHLNISQPTAHRKIKKYK